MTIAFIALMENGGMPESELQWLQQLLQAAGAAVPDCRVLLFTNQKGVFPALLRGVEVVEVAPSRNWWQRLFAHRRLQLQVAQQGVQKLVFWGMAAHFRTALPQALVITAADFRQKKVLRLRKAAFASLQLFVANSAAAANLRQLPGEQRNIQVLRGPLPRPALLEADTQVVKDHFTGGSEFFLYQGPLHETKTTVHLLKAFSRFKHRQKSGWKLVLLPEGPEPLKALQELLATYKYREDVVLATGLGPEEVDSVYAAAWCFVYPADPSYWGTPLIRAIQWHIPLIATEGCREWAGKAGLYAETGDEVQLADHLMAIYKDESLHSRLKTAALAQADLYGWQPLVEWLEAE